MSHAVFEIKRLPDAKRDRKTYLRRCEIQEGERKRHSNLIIRINMSTMCFWNKKWRQDHMDIKYV
jgi:hypothetical protein